MAKTNYTERELTIIGLYKAKIEELEDEILNLRCIVEHNANLDAQKLLSVSKTSKGLKFTFDKKVPIN